MFYDLYCDLCAQRDLSPSKAAETIGISKANVSAWKNKGYTPRGKALNDIADFFGVSVDYLLGKEEQKEKAPANAEGEEDPLSQVSFALFGTHEKIDEDILDDVRAYAKFKLEQQRKAAEEKK